ncbi:hypothetical protein D3C76_1698570 [compost metagenome]
MLKKEKLIELSKVAERTEQSEKEKCEHQNVLNKNRISLIKLREATLTKSINQSINQSKILRVCILSQK